MLQLKATKKAEEDLRSQLEEYRQTMTQEADDLRAQCQQLAAQLTSMKQSHSQMLLEHEKMTVSQIIRVSTSCFTIPCTANGE